MEKESAFMAISPTAQIVEVVGRDGALGHARVWDGKTAGGTPVQVLVMQVAARRDDDNSELERELHEVRPKRPDGPRAFDARMVI